MATYSQYMIIIVFYDCILLPFTHGRWTHTHTHTHTHTNFVTCATTLEKVLLMVLNAGTEQPTT